MSLIARLRRVDTGIEWLETWGELRRCELDLARLEMKEAIEGRLKANPGSEKARRMARTLGIVSPPLPRPPSVAPPAPVAKPVTPSPIIVARASPQRLPPEPKPPPEPSHDIPEHMQIRPTRWRQRDGSDVDDWEDGGGAGYGQCLTEYEPLKEDDDDS